MGITYPSPRRNNRRRHKTRFDGTTRSTEHFTSLQFIIVTLQDEGGQNHAEREKEAKTNDYPIADTLVKRRLESSHDVLNRYTPLSFNWRCLENLTSGKEGTRRRFDVEKS